MSEKRAVRIETLAQSDIGMTRRVNQDSTRIWSGKNAVGDSLAVLLVADGMGGHEGGEIASSLAVETAGDHLIEWLQAQSGEIDFEVLSAEIETAYIKTNDAIYQYSAKADVETGNMGTTLECVVLVNQRAMIGHVGDSRVYSLTRDGLKQISEDHSAVAELIAIGVLEKDDVYTHPNRNILTRGLGDGNPVEVDLVEWDLSLGERMLLCSDGLWGMVRDDELERIMLQARSLSQLADDLIAAANEGGGDDNIGVALCELMPG